MAKYLTDELELQSVANAIRAKGGTSESLAFPTDFVSAIADIPVGGNIEEDGNGNLTFSTDGDVIGKMPLSVTENGQYAAPSGRAYSPVSVSVQPNLQSKTVTQNGTVLPDAGYDGLSSVIVNVSGSGGMTSLQFHLGRLTINTGEIVESNEYCYSDLIPIRSGTGRWFIDLTRSDTESFNIGIAFYANNEATNTNGYIRQFEVYRSYTSSAGSTCKYFRIAAKVSDLSFANVACLTYGIFVVPQSGNAYQTNPA